MNQYPKSSKCFIVGLLLGIPLTYLYSYIIHYTYTHTPTWFFIPTIFCSTIAFGIYLIAWTALVDHYQEEEKNGPRP